MIRVYLNSGIEFFVLVACMVKDQENKAKACIRAKAWNEANPDKVKTRRAANKEKSKVDRKAYYEANKEKENASNRAWYIAHSADRKVYNKDYREANIEEIKAKDKVWREANPEKVKAKNANFKQTNPGYHKDYLEANPEYNKEYYLANAEKIKADSRAWREDNPEQYKLNNKKRRSRVNNSEGHLELGEDLKILRDQNYACVYCDADLNKVGYHADHIVPISKNGSSWGDNFQMLCPSCNMSKHNKMPWDY